ncbi:MAG: hypothetical protein JRI71_17240 [Deltaproteobacteria bacterium]|nr:hypothetical protein [Deltaproteobacteria bacterium]
MEEVTELSPETKRALIGMIDSRIEEKLKDRFPRREDFSELKSIVQELAQAQGRTEKRVQELGQAQKELAEAQKRTEIQVQNLARNVGKLSDNVGFGLEDIARVVLPGYLERHLGILVKEFSRKFFTVNSDKEGKRITVLGECKSRIYRREVRSFVRQADKVRGLVKGDILLVMFGYWIHPSASVLAEEKDLLLIASYQR